VARDLYLGGAENTDLPSAPHGPVDLKRQKLWGGGRRRQLALPQTRPRRSRIFLAELRFLLSREAKSESTFLLSEPAWRPGSSLARAMTLFPTGQAPPGGQSHTHLSPRERKGVTRMQARTAPGTLITNQDGISRDQASQAFFQAPRSACPSGAICVCGMGSDTYGWASASLRHDGIAGVGFG
jgi:hypothetical protein